MHPSWYVLPFLALVIYLSERKLRHEMLWTAAASLPLVLLWPLSTTGSLGVPTLIGRLLVGISAAAVASALYGLLLKQVLAPSRHPLRKKLLWLVVGPISLVLMHFLLPTNLLLQLTLALALDVAVILFIRPDLFWEAFLSGFGLGFLYLILFKLTNQPIPLELENLRLTNITLLGFPASQLLTVFLFGSLWGPLYLAVKEKISVPTTFVRPHQLLPRVFMGSGVLVLAVSGIGWGASLALASPEITVTSANKVLSLQDPIIIHFSAPVDRRALQLTIIPTIPGGWKFAGGKTLNHLYTEVQFLPDSYYAPGTTYTIHVNKIATVAGVGNGSGSFTIQTESLPTVQAIIPAKDARNIGLCEPLSVRLSTAVGPIAVFAFHLEPEVELIQKVDLDNHGYTLVPNRCLDPGTAYTLRAERTLTINSFYQGKPESVISQTFTTRAAVGLASVHPSGSIVSISTHTFTLTFDQAMKMVDPSNYLAINPATTGIWKWASTTTAIFTTATTLLPGTTYTITAKAGLPDASRGSIKTDISTTFTTLGLARVTSLLPGDGSSGVSSGGTLSIRFDQSVDHSSAEAAFSTTPIIKGARSWIGNTLIFSPTTPLEKDAQYTVKVSGLITNSDNQSTTIGVTHTFYTEESLTLLAIPVYYQQHALSCEAASLKMGLSYKGTYTSEEEIMSRVGYDPTARQGNIWGDPDRGFVGSLDGRQDSTGYGVYFGPVLQAANTFRASQSLTNSSVSAIATSIAAGNPVVFWGIYEGGSFYDPWTTPTGKTISAWHGEHVRLVIGFYGPASNPSHIIINDPIVGRVVWSASHFLSNWNTLGRQAVAVE